MPRVSDEYLANRRAEILAAAARCFAREGFHATSMSNVISEVGLSAGAVYRYFASKEEMIAAVAEAALATTDERFALLLADGRAPSPEEAVASLVQDTVEGTANDTLQGVDPARIALQVWAESLRSPAVREHVHATVRRLRKHFIEVARRWQAAGNLPPDADPELVGTALLSLAQGITIQRLLMEESSAGYIEGATALLAPYGRAQPAELAAGVGAAPA